MSNIRVANISMDQHCKLGTIDMRHDLADSMAILERTLIGLGILSECRGKEMASIRVQLVWGSRNR